MKKSTVAAALALSLGSVGAMADTSALVTLANESSAIQLTDQDLASVQGGWGWGERCFACYNDALVSQMNMSLASLGVLQSNGSTVVQENN